MKGNEAHDVMLKIQAYFPAIMTIVSHTKRLQPQLISLEDLLSMLNARKPDGG